MLFIANVSSVKPVREVTILAKKPGRLCVVHNTLIDPLVLLDHEERRLITVLVSLISKTDQDFKNYRIEIKQLATIFDVVPQNLYQEVKKATKKLMGKVMSLRRLDGRPGELQVAWLSKAEYIDGDGYVNLRFDPDLKPYLLQLQGFLTGKSQGNYTKWTLKEVVKFKSRFSYPLYLLLKQYLAVGYRTLTISELRKYLKIGDDDYPFYANLKKTVIKKAVDEINQKTSMTVEFQEIKEKRKVVSLYFTMRTKPQQTVDIDMLDESVTSAPTTDQAQDEIKHAQNTMAATTTMEPMLLEMSKYMPPENAQEWLDAKGAEYCRAQLVYTHMRNPKKFSAYLKKALAENYATYLDPRSEAAAAAEKEQLPKPAAPPDRNCPKCHGKGSYEITLDGELTPRTRPCDCIKL